MIIWNLVFDELINRIKNKYKNGEVKPIGYADDGTLTAAGTSIAKIIIRLNAALKEVKGWADEMGLRVSAEKTTATLFKKQQKRVKPQDWPQDGLKLNYNGIEIPFTDTVKYLGLEYDRHLNWSNHIKKKIKKVKGMIVNYKKAVRANWSPTQLLNKWLYETCYSPVLTYGCMIWGRNAVKYNTHIASLRSLQGSMLMQYGLFRRNTPHQALEIITGTLPLHLQIKKLMTEAAVRNLKFLDNTAMTSRYLLTLLTDSNFPTNPDLIDRYQQFESRKAKLII